MIESYRAAQILAQKLIDEARKNEPRITADLQKIAREVSAEMVGLENKFKSEESLIRKLLLLADRDKSHQTILQKLEKFARYNNDALRYTLIFTSDKYAENFALTIRKLEESGFSVPPNRIWNAWETAATPRDAGYRGINITAFSSQKQRFELQFHTAESFQTKTSTHDLYAEMRNLKTSEERRAEIIKELLKSAAGVERPQGI